jgi:surface polysaccharide O-acyltransferase-like enzyme
MDTMWFGYAITVTATIMLCRVEQAAPSSRLAAFSSCTAGMYLVHILFIFAIHFFTPIGIAWAPVVVMLSFATTLLARRTRLRWMFP